MKNRKSQSLSQTLLSGDGRLLAIFWFTPLFLKKKTQTETLRLASWEFPSARSSAYLTSEDPQSWRCSCTLSASTLLYRMITSRVRQTNVMWKYLISPKTSMFLISLSLSNATFKNSMELVGSLFTVVSQSTPLPRERWKQESVTTLSVLSETVLTFTSASTILILAST